MDESRESDREFYVTAGDELKCYPPIEPIELPNMPTSRMALCLPADVAEMGLREIVRAFESQLEKELRDSHFQVTDKCAILDGAFTLAQLKKLVTILEIKEDLADVDS